MPSAKNPLVEHRAKLLKRVANASRRPLPTTASVPMVTDFDNPASWLKVFELARPVVSCASAAEAKGVPLTRELKSLLLQTDHGLVLAHLPGDRRLSLRAVKRLLGTHQALLADDKLLTSLGLAPGTINPFQSELWELPHLISPHVLTMSWVTSNAGSLTTYIVFPPRLLLDAARSYVGDIEAE